MSESYSAWWIEKRGRKTKKYLANIINSLKSVRAYMLQLLHTTTN